MKLHCINDYLVQVVRRNPITMAELARRTGIPMQSLHCILTSRYRMTIDNLIRVCLALGCSPNDLLPFDTDSRCSCRDLQGPVTEADLQAAAECAQRRLPPLPDRAEVIVAASMSVGITVKEMCSKTRVHPAPTGRIVAVMLVMNHCPHITIAAIAPLLGLTASSLSTSRIRAMKKPWILKVAINAKRHLDRLLEKRS